MRTRELSIAAFAVLALLGITRAEAQGAYGIGRVATPAEIAGWNIDIDRDGHNLPPGSGSVSHGHEVFDQQCAACHGAKGEGGLGDQLVGGQGTIATPKPVRTVGSYWPYGSDPTPLPSIIGTPPSSAAMVVIRRGTMSRDSISAAEVMTPSLMSVSPTFST
jgi:hypothetical protein